MYAAESVGLPVDDSALVLSNTGAVYNNGMLSLSFTRALNSGHNPLPNNVTASPFDEPMFMWAIGNAPSSCTGSPSYHGYNRGVHIVSVVQPQLTFPDIQVCKSA
jgi:hypothetical protein